MNTSEPQIDLIGGIIQAIPSMLKVTWPLWALVGVMFFFKEVLPLILKRQRQAQWFEAQKTIKDIQNLKPKQFETFCAVLFGKLGFQAKTTSYAKDGGVDVIAIRNGETHFIQCKKYVTRKVNLSHVRDFYGAMADAGCNRGFFVSTGFYTLDAEQFAAGKPIELIDGPRLMEYVKQSGVSLNSLPQIKKPIPLRAPSPIAPQVPLTVQPASQKDCPKCGAQLVRRTAKRGANAGSDFWGCSGFPKCRFTEVLS
jgi:restriction system protein